MEIILNKDNFEAEVLKSPLPILVDFWAEWCAPCRMIAPVLSELAHEYRDRLRIGKLNVDEEPELASRYQVQSIPNMKLFRKGEAVDELVGSMPKAEILKRLKKYLV